QIGHRFKTGDGHFTHPLVTDQLAKSRNALQDRRRGADATNAKRAAKRYAQRDAERALTESPSVAPSATHSETLGEAGATKLSLSASPSGAPSETLSARSAGRNQSQIPKSDPIQSQSERQGGAGEAPAPAGPDLGEIRTLYPLSAQLATSDPKRWWELSELHNLRRRPREAQHEAMEQILTSTRRAS
ncbi:MAG TPA: hypothetical protein VHO06_13875, partial [Polyangia bacterium]|nr:hypothetical protein [Polyangia bacterium]